MNIRTVILDDDTGSVTAAVAALSDYSDIEIVGRFFKSEELFNYLENHTAHLLFLDIELDDETGFSIARRLKETHADLMIVFLTGHSSYAIDGYDFHPIDFLTKPINKVKLERTIEEVRERMKRNNGQHSAKLLFHLQHGYRIIDVRDICYIERLDRKNYLHTPTETICISGYTMSELEEMLTEHGFFLCHQSFLVSLYRIQSVRDIKRQLYEAQVQDCSKPVPISRNCYLELMKRLQKISTNKAQ